MNTKLILAAAMASALIAGLQTTSALAQNYDVAKRYGSQPLPVPGQFDDTLAPRLKDGTAPAAAPAAAPPPASAVVANARPAGPGGVPAGAPPGGGAPRRGGFRQEIGGTGGPPGFPFGIAGLNRVPSPTYAGPPEGMQPLAKDVFASKNFYEDRALWPDKRYWRCNFPRQMTDVWTVGRIGKTPPSSAAWGDCSIDLPASYIQSPYDYKTAAAHYAALMAKTRAHGGPTVYTKATVPDWDGYYQRDNDPNRDRSAEWLWGNSTQVSSTLALLTPEYQKREVQDIYHESITNAPQWEASFCYPEGILRWWTQASQGGNFQLTMTPWNVQFLSGIADNFIRQVNIGRSHVLKTNQWMGETVGFWDGDTLVTWTKNVQPWTISHSMIEYSDKFEVVETFKPAYDAARKFIGLDHEAIVYDPKAYVKPLRLFYRYVRVATPENTDRRFTYIECKTNLRNVNGRPSQLTKADPRFVDTYGRPWAQAWENHYEQGWVKPEISAAPQDVLDLFK